MVSLMLFLVCQILVVHSYIWNNNKGANKEEPRKGGPTQRKLHKVAPGNGEPNEVGPRRGGANKGEPSKEGPVKRPNEGEEDPGEGPSKKSKQNICIWCGRCLPEEEFCMCMFGKISVLETT